MADAGYGEGRQEDFDTSGGTALVEVSGIVVPSSGGPIIVGGATIADAATFGIGLSVNALGIAYNGSTVDRLRTADGFVTAAASPQVGLLAALPPDRRFTSVNLGTVVGNTQVWDVLGAANAMLYIGTTQTGTFIVEVSADGTNYISAETRDVASDLWVSGTNLTPTAQKVYRVVTTGWRNLRVRTVTTLGGTVAVTATLAPSTAIINAIDTGPAAHSFGYAPVWKRVTASSAQTGAAIWTPASGRRVVLTELLIGIGGTVAGTCTVWFGGSADTTYTGGTDQPVFEHEFAPSSTLKPGVVIGNGAGLIGYGAVDDVLRLTTTNALVITVIARGYETA